MDKQQQKLTETKSKSLDKVLEVVDKPKNKKGIWIGTTIATIIALTPYLFNLYESVPNEKVWNTFLFTYDSNYYGSVKVFAWTLVNKLIPLLLLFLWFFTCRHWWYHTLLIPIAMYIYQIIIIVNDDLTFADRDEILYLLPVMAIIIPSIYLVRAKMFNKINDADKSLQELEDEFMIRPKGFFNKLKDYF